MTNNNSSNQQFFSREQIVADLRELERKLTDPEATIDNLGSIVARCLMELEGPTVETRAPLSYNDLERRMYRMFEHGKTNNTASAQCEAQSLRIAMGWTGPGASIQPSAEETTDVGRRPNVPEGSVNEPCNQSMPPPDSSGKAPAPQGPHTPENLLLHLVLDMEHIGTETVWLSLARDHLFRTGHLPVKVRGD